jgi:hypothetical protein
VTDARASYDKRLGKVETEQARQGERLDGIDGRMDRLERDVGKVGSGVDELLRRDAARPAPTSWRTATAASISGLLALLAGFSWWFTSVSPAVQDLDRRMTRIDDKDIGRMPRVERRVDELERWAPRVTRN